MDALLRKMKYVPSASVTVVGAPQGFIVAELLSAVGQSFVEDFKGRFDWMVICVMNRVAVVETVPRAANALSEKGMLWICYPKKSGQFKTDLSRDHGWESIAGIGLRHLNLISIDDDWSAWAVEHGTKESSEKTEQKSETRNTLLAQYLNHETREMRYPPEMEAALNDSPEAKAYFLQLSFTNRKEYLEWIITAKRKETQLERLEKMIGYLNDGRKNPSSR